MPATRVPVVRGSIVSRLHHRRVVDLARGRAREALRRRDRQARCRQPAQWRELLGDGVHPGFRSEGDEPFVVTGHRDLCDPGDSPHFLFDPVEVDPDTERFHEAGPATDDLVHAVVGVGACEVAGG